MIFKNFFARIGMGLAVAGLVFWAGVSHGQKIEARKDAKDLSLAIDQAEVRIDGFVTDLAERYQAATRSTQDFDTVRSEIGNVTIKAIQRGSDDCIPDADARRVFNEFVDKVNALAGSAGAPEDHPSPLSEFLLASQTPGRGRALEQLRDVFGGAGVGDLRGPSEQLRAMEPEAGDP